MTMDHFQLQRQQLHPNLCSVSGLSTRKDTNASSRSSYEVYF